MDPFNGKYGQLVRSKDIGSKVYITTERSFTKSQPLRVAQGGATGWLWGPQRLRNEARVLEFLAKNTTIPVPRVLEYGYDRSNCYYVTMERFLGTPLDEIGKECHQPKGVRHVASGQCPMCPQIASQNADAFIRNVVRPQLQQFKAKQTGFEGFVLPPPRIVETRDRGSWPVRTSQTRDYTLVHGDLAPHNIAIDMGTLEVEKIFDWEQAGFFPPVMDLELWCMPVENYYALFRDDELIEREIELITP